MSNCFIEVMLALTVATSAMADITLPPIAYTESAIDGGPADNGPPNSFSPGILQFLNPSEDGGGSGTVTIISNPSSGLTISTQVNGNVIAYGRAVITVEISGPQNINVPLDISGFTSSIIANGGFGLAEVYSPEFSDGTQLFAACSGNSLDESCTGSNVTAGSGPFSLNVLVPTNEAFAVDVYAGGDSFDPGGLNNTSVVVQADPYFQLDPTFVRLNPGYSLNFSPDFSNVQGSAAPEPNLFWLVLFAASVLAGKAKLQKRPRTFSHGDKGWFPLRRFPRRPCG